MTLRRFLGRIGRQERGLAFVEFAFGAPILLLVTLGGLELANYALAHLRVNQIAMTVADNAGRVMVGIDEANVYEVFAGASIIGESIDFEENGRVVLSSLQDNGKTNSRHGQMISWQRCWGEFDVDPAYGQEGTGRNNDTLEDGMGRPGNRIMSIPGTEVMFVEATYEYQPLISATMLPLDPIIRHESAFNVRGRQPVGTPSNGNGLVKATCS